MLSYQMKKDLSVSLEMIQCIEHDFADVVRLADNLINSEKIFLMEIQRCYMGQANGRTTYVIEGLNNKEIKALITKNVDDFVKTYDFIDGHSKLIEYKESINEKILNCIKCNTIKDDIKKVIEYIEEFFKCYQNMIRSNRNYELITGLKLAVLKFYEYISNLINSYSKTLDISNTYLCVEEVDKEENKEILEIQLLDIKYSFKEFTEKLSSIEKVYEALGNIIYPDTENVCYAKLEIIKVESGSLFSKILGDGHIMEAFGKLLNKTIELIFNKFTYEGKICRHKELMVSLKAEVELCKELKAIGVDISSTEEAIEHSFAIITKELCKIACSSPKIEIDGRTHSVGNKQSEDKFIEANQTMLLADANGKDNSSTDEYIN